MRAVSVAMTTLALLGLVGCSEDSGPPEPLAIDEAASAAPVDEPSSSPVSPAEGDASQSPPAEDKASDAGRSGVSVGQLPAGGPEAAAADAYVEYLRVRTEAFRTVQVDLVALSSVAIGAALQDVQGGVAYRAREKLHMVGDLRVDVTDVTVDGRTARLTACLDNGTAEANRRGRIVEQDPPEHYRSTAEVRRFGPDVWLVGSVDYTEVTDC
jgi:hypothetical protein